MYNYQDKIEAPRRKEPGMRALRRFNEYSSRIFI